MGQRDERVSARAWPSCRRDVNRRASFTADRFAAGRCKRAVVHGTPLTADAFGFHRIDKGLELRIQISAVHAAHVSCKPNFFLPTDRSTRETPCHRYIRKEKAGFAKNKETR